MINFFGFIFVNEILTPQVCSSNFATHRKPIDRLSLLYSSAINSSPEPKDWPKFYRQLYSKKQRYQTKPSSPIYPIAPVFTYPTIPHRIVFPDPNNAVPPAFHPYPPAIFRPIPPPGLFRT